MARLSTSRGITLFVLRGVIQADCLSSKQIPEGAVCRLGQRSCWQQSGAYTVVWGVIPHKHTHCKQLIWSVWLWARRGVCQEDPHVLGLGASLPEAGATGPRPFLGGKQEPSILCPQKSQPHPSWVSLGLKWAEWPCPRGACPQPCLTTCPEALPHLLPWLFSDT